MSRRGGKKKTGKLALGLALVLGGIATVGAFLVVLAMGPGDSREWAFGGLAAVLVGVAVAIGAWVQGSGLGSRMTDLQLAVSKLGRGSAEVRVRISGNDEITALGRAVQYLSTDLQEVFKEIDDGGGKAATMDPQVRELRDLALGDQLPQPEGYEVDGQIGAGNRGGLDYFGAAGNVAYVVSAEGATAVSVLACRMARDELARALDQGVSARKALAHTNKVLHKKLPRGACAKASLMEMGDGEVKLYQAGYRAPLWICKAGEVLEIEADGLALGLDAGPVFEKGLRPQTIAVQFGVRLVQTNDAGVRMQEFLDLVQEHSPKHTMPFMHLVIGALESDGDGLREDVLLLTVKKAD